MTWTMDIGDTDTRTAIQARHGGSRSRGISAPAVGLGAGDITLWWRPEHGDQYGYQDGWGTDGAFYFTGTGQFGDQVFGTPNAENGRVRDHVTRGDRLRLLRYVATNEVRYVGEFRLDIADPWRWRDGPDAISRTRRMIQFRMLPVGQVGRTDDDPAHVTHTGGGPEPLAAIPNKPVQTEVEALRKPSFLRLVQAREEMTRREELELVHRFKDWLASRHGVESTGLRIHTGASSSPLRADLFAPSQALLIEAKASSAREHVRMAIGQLLDYGRYLSPQVSKCVLTPTRPSEDMLALLTSLQIGSAWSDRHSFEFAGPVALRVMTPDNDTAQPS